LDENTACKAAFLVNIAHSAKLHEQGPGRILTGATVYFCKWSKLNSVRKRNLLALQPDAAPVRRSRAVSPDDPSATSPRAGVVSLN
jgi:hypothetical protein